jgi:hypothetical protein
MVSKSFTFLLENNFQRKNLFCVKDCSGALYCFVESNLFQKIAFYKAIKAGVESLTFYVYIPS